MHPYADKEIVFVVPIPKTKKIIIRRSSQTTSEEVPSSTPVTEFVVHDELGAPYSITI